MDEYLVKIRRELHMYPEVQFDLEKTINVVSRELKSFGLTPNYDCGKSSITATIIINKSFKTIALRADMDALNIAEENDVTYKSLIKGKSHACGHDAHTAMLLGAAKIISKEKDKLKYNVKFIFQSSEEGPESGAKYLVEDGVLDDVDMVFSMHVTNELDSGTAGVSIGNAMASATRFAIEIIGKGGHAGMPHLAVDAIAMSAMFINNIQNLVAREINPFSPVVVNIGTIHGGTISNAVAGNVKMKGTIRTFSDEVTAYVIEHMEKIIKSISENSGGTYKLKFNPGLPAVINEKEITTEFADKIKEIIGKNNFFDLEGKMGAEDFSYYLKKKPGCFIWLGTGSDEKHMRAANHNPSFDIDEDGMNIGVNIFKGLLLRKEY